MDTTYCRINVAMHAQSLRNLESMRWKGLASKIGWHVSTLKFRVNAICGCRADWLEEIAAALDVPVEALKPGGPKAPLVGE